MGRNFGSLVSMFDTFVIKLDRDTIWHLECYKM